MLRIAWRTALPLWLARLSRAGLERGDELLLAPGLEAAGVDGAVEDARGTDPVCAQGGARDKGTHDRLMKRLARVDLLLLDDWGLQGFSAEGRRDLLEIVEARHGRKSILIASQIPLEHWPKVIGEPTHLTL